MQTWIFQDNTDNFDMDGYFATWPSQFTWNVARYADQIAVGDRVFIWRQKGQRQTVLRGKRQAVSGIIAEATVIAEASPRPISPDAMPFLTSDDSDEAQTRALLHLVRVVAKKKEVIDRAWFEEDPILHDLPKLMMQTGTNYLVPPGQVTRLVALWNRTGQDWSYEESVAGLWAFKQTYGGPVSRRPGSPVSTVSVTVSRFIPGVYNKVMNFRSLDPRDRRAGLSGSSEMDKKVWAQFYDATTNQLDHDAVELEFRRLWPMFGRETDTPIVSAPLPNVVEEIARRLEDDSLETLLAKYFAGTASRQERPSIVTTTIRLFERWQIVVAIARKRAEHRCEVPDCVHPIFHSDDGLPFCEVHHIEPLGDGGKDKIENVACVCPAHHREAHHGKQREKIAQQLRDVRRSGAGGETELAAAE
jgi:hypothetical protein